jgi:hypothetical protein
MGKMRNKQRILVGKPERKRSIARSRRMSKNNIKMNLE